MQHRLVVGADEQGAERMVAGVHRAARERLGAVEHGEHLGRRRLGAVVRQEVSFFNCSRSSVFSTLP